MTCGSVCSILELHDWVIRKVTESFEVKTFKDSFNPKVTFAIFV